MLYNIGISMIHKWYPLWNTYQGSKTKLHSK